MKIQRILISQPPPTSDKSPYSELINKYNVKIDFKPFIQVEPLTPREFRQQHINFADYTAIVFTSKMHVDNFFKMCEELRVTIPETMKYFCINEATAFYLQKYVVFRKRKIFYGNNQLEDMKDYFLKNKDCNYLVPVTEPHKASTLEALNRFNLKYTAAVFSRTVSNNMKDVNLNDYQIIVFFTPAGIKSLFENFPDFNQGNIIIGTSGTLTAQAAREAGLNVQIESPTKEFASITAALDAFIKKCLKEK
ncbi:MAG: uroporphyrinogen-III synthase [Bacteroidales bacterium]|nr:uroporphyrinogen-III synthase [Bacteroidales bacterium]